MVQAEEGAEPVCRMFISRYEGSGFNGLRVDDKEDRDAIIEKLNKLIKIKPPRWKDVPSSSTVAEVGFSNSKACNLPENIEIDENHYVIIQVNDTEFQYREPDDSFYELVIQTAEKHDYHGRLEKLHQQHLEKLKEIEARKKHQYSQPEN